MYTARILETNYEMSVYCERFVAKPWWQESKEAIIILSGLSIHRARRASYRNCASIKATATARRRPSQCVLNALYQPKRIGNEKPYLHGTHTISQT